jgi:hypothetical protein
VRILILPLLIVSFWAAACGGGEKPPASPTSGMMGGSMPMMGGGGPVVSTTNDPRAALFLQKGCPQCHTISALGIKSPAEIGPDLTFAYSDVQNRFGMKLEEFLHNPTGTMAIVLSSQIQLSSGERDSVIHILKGLYEENEAKKRESTHE